MAKLDKDNTQRIPSSSLLEVMVALVVIFTVFGFATGLYSNILGSSYSLRIAKARLEVEKTAQETRKNHRFIDESFTVGEFDIQKTVKPYGRGNNVLEIHIVAKGTEGKVLAEYKSLLLQILEK